MLVGPNHSTCELRVKDLEFRVQGLELRVQDLSCSSIQLLRPGKHGTSI